MQLTLFIDEFIPHIFYNLESYREDYAEANTFYNEDADAKQEFYINMKSGAESGWDYSTKW